MDIKTSKSLAIFVGIYGPVILTCLFLMITGTVTLSISGFAVDSNNRLYIGKDSGITVYENGVIDHTINPKTSRGYIFTMQPNDTIVVSTGSVVYTMDIDGNLISQEEDFRSRMYHEIRKNGNPFYSTDGTKYTKRSPWGRIEIIQEIDGRVSIIYQMTLFDYIIKIVLAITFVSIFIFVPRLVLKSRNLKI